MKRTVTKWKVWKETTEVFFSRSHDYVSIVETVTLFGWTLKEEEREVYIPNMNDIYQVDIKVIADAYLELHEIIRRLEEYEED